MFRKVLIANRGVIACRIIRTLRRMGIRSVAVYSEADIASMHVEQADEAICIGPPQAARSYLSIDAILKAAHDTGAEAIHPGYGFLSENAGFAEACEKAGIIFLGPTPAQMRSFGLKHTSRSLAKESRLPLLPGTGLLPNVKEASAAASDIGYPVMLKSTAGGGGIGMRLCRSQAELFEAFDAVARLGKSNFGDGGVFLEKAVQRARHIEVQIFGDGGGRVVSLGERDCSAQRRNQKVIEETPAPNIPVEVRQRLLQAASRLGSSIKYRSAGTVEFIYDDDTNEFYFLEVNTRLQVEHGVTEEVTGLDLVECMIRLGAGETILPEPKPSGASIQVRIYAEDPAKDFQPCSGRLTEVVWPEGIRLETHISRGAEVSPFYDPMLAKLIVRADNRASAVQKLTHALEHCRLAGIETNLSYLRQVVRSETFAEGRITTAFLGTFPYHRHAVEVIGAGTQTTVQDYPGRLGLWNVGVPPSGPIDSLAFRTSNRLVGNPEDAAGLEIAVTGPTLRFPAAARIAITGADFAAKVDGKKIERWSSVDVPAGAQLEFGSAQGAGSRAYLAIGGGIDVPSYLGSRSTFILGKFGGHAGRALAAGDVLHLGHDTNALENYSVVAPTYGSHWTIGVTYGPHGAPDFFTEEDIQTFFDTDWKVHYNSDRTGIRLIGPKPNWARRDGGEAGLHPSNIHDNAYAVGTIDFTGDMPVILGPDGPSLGGFVCPATIVEAERWKTGQLKPGDTIRFVPVSQDGAEALEAQLDRAIQYLSGEWPSLPEPVRSSPVLHKAPGVAIRSDGDKYLLIEFGENVLDFKLRFRVHALERELRSLGLTGILDITPGVRSLHVHYDTRRLSRDALLEALDYCEKQILGATDISAPSRTVYLPLSWDDPQTRLAIQKYTQSVRPGAPWCPSNIEFIRRINGLNSIDDVSNIVYNASYLVLGLGDVYLGAPVATPIDPRHRLVTTKYNPARTWTPENAVGIGGAYLCVYGMEGPGGYQFVGRTLQMWNTWKSTSAFEPGSPWLLRFFDQIRFLPVSAEELLEIRRDFPLGRYPLRVEPGEFHLADYERYLASISAEAAQFKRTQQAAFEEERERWAATGQASFISEADTRPQTTTEASIPDGCTGVLSPIAASVWNIGIQPGQVVEAGQRLIVLEAMKMEIAVVAPVGGVVEALFCAEGGLVSAGQSVAAIRTGAM